LKYQQFNKLTNNTMPQRKCLILEKHDWETGFSEEQIQIKKSVCNNFFGRFRSAKSVTFQIFYNRRARSTRHVRQCRISLYRQNTTYRINGFFELGMLPSSFIFFQEIGNNEYEVWWEKRDKAIIVAHFKNENWKQAKNSQYGRGRLCCVVDAPVPKIIKRIN